MRNILRSISWLNNAGIPGDMSKTSWDTDMMDIKETTDVNYFGTLAITQALLPLIKQNEGRIVNVTVPSEISPYWHPLAYVASKAAQNAMMGVMAMEFKQNNIPVEIFSVHPGPTTTDLNGNMDLPGFIRLTRWARNLPNSSMMVSLIMASLLNYILL